MAAWILDINLVSGGSMDYRSLSRKLNLENEPFFTLDILLLLRVRVILQLDSVSGARTYACSRLLYTTLLLAPVTLPVSWVWQLYLQPTTPCTPPSTCLFVCHGHALKFTAAASLVLLLFARCYSVLPSFFLCLIFINIMWSCYFWHR